jgi:hypothetical protein
VRKGEKLIININDNEGYSSNSIEITKEQLLEVLKPSEPVIKLSTEEKMRNMFIELYGDIDADDTPKYTEFVDPSWTGEDAAEPYISVMKDGTEAWRITRSELHFEYTDNEIGGR